MKHVITVFTALVLACAGAAAFAAENPLSAMVEKPAASIERVNINSADAETLANSLHRVGIKKAESIVAWRQANGRFNSLEQLMEVKGIGEAIIEANRERIDL